MAHDVRIERRFAAEPREVFTAFAGEDGWAAWMWPPSMQATGSLDARDGGSFALRSEPADLGCSGTVRAVNPPDDDRGYLDLTWQWDGDGHASRVVVEVTGSPAGTTLVLTHTLNQDEDEARRHREGWDDCLDRLAEHLLAS
jgi:uncharacterized protein YndB with AHSA1/START domain